MTKAYDAWRFERLGVLFAYLNKELLRNNQQLKSQYDRYVLFCIFYASLNEAKNTASFKEMGKKFEDGLKKLDLENFVNKTTIKIGIPWNMMLYLIKKKKYRMLMVLCRRLLKSSIHIKHKEKIMKKICFITRHAIVNYGSFLQTYATQKLFEGYGYNAEVWIMFEKMKNIIM